MAVTGSTLPVPEALVRDLSGVHQLGFLVGKTGGAVGGGALGLRSSSWRVGSGDDFNDVANDMAELLPVPVASDTAEEGWSGKGPPPSIIVIPSATLPKKCRMLTQNMELIGNHRHFDALGITPKTFVVGSPRFYCVGTPAMKIGEGCDAGACSPHITSISSFDLWR